MLAHLLVLPKHGPLGTLKLVTWLAGLPQAMLSIISQPMVTTAGVEQCIKDLEDPKAIHLVLLRVHSKLENILLEPTKKGRVTRQII